MPVPLLIVVFIVGLVITGIIFESIYTICGNLIKNKRPPLSKSEIQMS